MRCYTTTISRGTCRSGFEGDALSNVRTLSNSNAAERVNEAESDLAALQSLVRSRRLRHKTDGASEFKLPMDEKQWPSSHLVRTVRKRVPSWQMRMSSLRDSDGGRLASKSLAAITIGDVPCAVLNICVVTRGPSVCSKGNACELSRISPPTTCGTEPSWTPKASPCSTRSRRADL